jgi:hypothetical protein
MKLSPCGEAASRSATQEFPDILWNPKIYDCVDKSPPPVSILSQVNPIHTPRPISLRSLFILVLYSRLHVDIPSGVFPSRFPTKTLYAFN